MIFIENILEFIMSLVLFLFGMNVIETGLKNISAGKLSKAIESAGKSPIKGLLIGAGVTAVLQSSSAVTVMLVGAADAGIIKLKNTFGIILGANIGTSATAWIIALSGYEAKINPISLYPIAGLIGIAFIILSKNINKYSAGLILVGFTLIMAGINGMSAAVEPLSYTGKFTGFLTQFDNPLFGILAGAVTSAVMQSSSAAIGILQALSQAGGLTLLTAVPIILGQNIGTCVTAVIAAVGAGRSAKMVAAAHLLFNVFGVVIWTVVFLITRGFLPDMTIGSTDIALIHTLFNVTSAIVVLGIKKAFPWGHCQLKQREERAGLPLEGKLSPQATDEV